MTVGIILAAGMGTRYRALTGRDKLTDPISGDGPRHGIPTILAAIDSLAASVDGIVCVVNPRNAAAIALLSRTGCTLLPFASGGLGHSISHAVGHSPDARGWLILLGDMPFVRAETVDAIAQALTPAAIVAPLCQGKRGHPVGFGSAFHDDLLALTGDTGARALLAAHPPTLVETDDTGTITDMDAWINLSKPVRMG